MPEFSHAMAEQYRRKANREYEMAGLARQDGDKKAAERHTRSAKEFDAMARDVSEMAKAAR